MISNDFSLCWHYGCTLPFQRMYGIQMFTFNFTCSSFVTSIDKTNFYHYFLLHKFHTFIFLLGSLTHMPKNLCIKYTKFCFRIFLFEKGGVPMSKKKYRLPLWLRRVRDLAYQFIIPLTLFQLVRTIFFPSTIDVMFLAILVFLYLSVVFEWF